MSTSELRRRKGKGWFPREVSCPAYEADEPLDEDETWRFWAVHTEQSGLFMLRFATLYCTPFFLTFCLLHILSGQIKISRHEFLVSLPVYASFVLSWVGLRMIEPKLKRWPVLLGSALQVVAALICVIGAVACARCMTTELTQHRIFWSIFFIFLVLCSVFFYVPRPVYVFIICPTFIVGWYSFHILADYLTPPCIVFGPLTVMGSAWLQRVHDERLRHAFETKEALLKERRLLQKMQESLQGVLSSIFDASCTCDSDGQTVECSPQLQDILDCLPGDQASGCSGLNLCSSAASDEERHRLQIFLKSALGSARQQAAKIQCSFRRKLGGVVEASLYAIALPSVSSSGDQHDVLFVALQTQAIDVDPCKDVAEQECHSAEEELIGDALDMPASKALIEDSRKFYAIPWTTPEDLSSSKSAADNVDLGSVDSLSISISMPSNYVHTHHPTVRSVETQTRSAVCTVDAEVQTLGSMAKPPARPSERPPVTSAQGASGATQAASAASEGSLATQNRRKACRGKRQVATSPFKATSPEIIEQVIVGSALSINPFCVPSCCRRHTILRFMRHQITSMLKSTRCANGSIEQIVQCQDCLCLQADESFDEEPACGYCGGSHLLGHNGSDGSQTSGAAADNEFEMCELHEDPKMNA